MTYRASWRHERILRRPKREDRPSAQARDGQEPSRPHLLRLAVLRQTRRGGSLASPQEETRLKTQDRRASQKAARRRPQGATFHHSATEVRVPAGGGRIGGQSLHYVPSHKADGLD